MATNPRTAAYEADKKQQQMLYNLYVKPKPKPTTKPMPAGATKPIKGTPLGPPTKEIRPGDYIISKPLTLPKPKPRDASLLRKD